MKLNQNNILDLGIINNRLTLNILINMYDQYTFSLKGCETILSRFITYKKDYMICMERKSLDTRLWTAQNNSSYEYLCTFTIQDIFGRELIKLNMSEVDVLVMLDNISEYLMNGNCILDTWLCNTKAIDPSKMNSLYLYKVYPVNNVVYNGLYTSDEPIHYLKIREQDLKTNVLIDRFTIEFDTDSLELFSQLIFFTFLLDTDLTNTSQFNFGDWVFL